MRPEAMSAPADTAEASEHRSTADRMREWREAQAHEDDQRRRLAELLAANPNATGAELAAALGVSDRHARRLKNEILPSLTERR